MMFQNQVALEIAQYDFERIRSRIIVQKSLPADVVDDAIEEFKKFLTLIKKYPGKMGMISAEVDEVWHTFILYTQEYMKFCQDIYGYYLHHMPNDGFAPQSKNDSGQNFIERYLEHFGPLPAIWTRQQEVLAICNNSGCDSSDNCSASGPGCEN